jgi:hypothetical protein
VRVDELLELLDASDVGATLDKLFIGPGKPGHVRIDSIASELEPLVTSKLKRLEKEIATLTENIKRLG